MKSVRHASILFLVSSKDKNQCGTESVRRRFPGCAMFSPMEGYAGDKLGDALAGSGGWTIEIIKRSDKAKGFQVLHRRWVVERTFAWLGRYWRLAKDWETTVASSTVWATIASIRMLTRRTARYYCT